MLTENLDLFFQDFGVQVTAGGLTGVGILDMPTQMLRGDMVLSTEYSLTVKTAQFGALGYNDQIVVDGSLYQVRDLMSLDDGAIARVSLSRLTVSTGVFVADVFVSGVFT